MSGPKPLRYQLFELPFRAVHIQCLNAAGEPLRGKVASGFVVREADGTYLYTCWHVVTGFDPHDIRVGQELPDRRALLVSLQDAQRRQPEVEVVGGLQTTVMQLYGEDGRPMWFQDEAETPNVFLNAIGLKVPFWHDAVKIRLPDELALSDLQVVDPTICSRNDAGIGDRVYIAGYPYGYSALGPDQPTPVVLTRFVASRQIQGRRVDILLESAGAPGMSGAPVFVERGPNIELLGIYTGLIYPDHVIERNEKVTALGTVCCMHMMWDHLALRPYAPR